MSDLKGLTEKEVEESRKTNGSNALTQIPPEPLWKKIMEGFREPMIMILLVALAVETVMFFMGETGMNRLGLSLPSFFPTVSHPSVKTNSRKRQLP